MFHIPENQPPVQVTVTTARSSGGPSLVAANWPAAWTAFPKILVIRRVGVLTTALEATAITGSTLTISGPIDGYSDAAQQIGDTIEVDPTALSITELQAAITANADKQVQRDTYLAYQDFSGYADGALTTLQTGQTWVQNTIGPTQTAVIVGGMMGGSASGNSTFATVDLGANVFPGLTWCNIVFGASGIGGSAAGILISDRNPMDLTGSNLTHIVHVIFGNLGWSIGTFTDGVLTYIAEVDYAAPLVCNGFTQYPCGCLIKGDTITLYPPDGTQSTYTNSLIGSYNGRYVTFESFSPATTRQVWFGTVAVEESDLAKLPLTAPGFIQVREAISGAVGQVPGFGANAYTGLQQAPTFTASGAASGYIITRRDDGAAVYTIYSSAGVFQLYSLTASGDVFAIDGAGNVALNTIVAGAWQGTAIADAYIASAATWNAKAGLGANTFTGLQLSTTFGTYGGLAGYTLNRRDNNVLVYTIYSAAGNFQVYSNVMSADVFTITPAGVISGNGSGMTNLNPANLAGTPASITGSKAGNTALASTITKLVAAFPNLFSDGTT